MADKVVQLKNKDGDKLYPVSVLPGERILWKDSMEPAPTMENVEDMTGATSSAAGKHGLVPAPAAGDQDKALAGDGTWKEYAPRQSSYYKGPVVGEDNCVFNINYESDLITNTESKMFNAAVTIGSTTYYGTIITTERIFDDSGVHCEIEQEFKRLQTATHSHEITYRRRGYINGVQGDQIEANKASITWSAWSTVPTPENVTLTITINDSNLSVDSYKCKKIADNVYVGYIKLTATSSFTLAANTQKNILTLKIDGSTPNTQFPVTVNFGNNTSPAGGCTYLSGNTYIASSRNESSVGYVCLSFTYIKA